MSIVTSRRPHRFTQMICCVLTKFYKCRKAGTTDNWTPIEAPDAETAASIFAEEGGAIDGDKVTVLGVGNFRINEVSFFEAWLVKP